MVGRARILTSFLLFTLLVSGCSRPAVPKAAVRLTLTVDGLLQSYAQVYNLRERAEGNPQQIAEAYMQKYQPGPLPRVFEHSIITDRNGTQLAEWVDEGRRTWVPLSEISSNLINAVIATEDSSFYQNQGIDPRRLIGAIMQNAEEGDIVSGASTITMQLARNLFFAYDLRFNQSVERKGFEALLAQDLTRLYTKDELLEMYLNLIYFGHNTYGVEAAAQAYFGKPAAALSLAEATLIAGIPQAPARYDPFVDFEAAKERQRTVLDLMARHGYLTQADTDRIYATSITLAEDPDLRPRYARHFVQFLREETQARLGQVRADRAGLHITSSLDLPMQQMAEKIVGEQVAQLRPSYDLSNAALVAMRPGTAEIVAMVGSANFDDDTIDGKVNVATSLRQPGSSIKPILYATALNDNLISPSTVFWDVPAEYDLEDDKKYKPQNYDEKFHGPVTARTALANSYNIPAVKLLDATGVQRMLDVGREMGLVSLLDDAKFYGLSLTLGGGEVRLLDLATAYHTIANGGNYLPYQPVLSMHDGAGRPLDLFARPEAKPIISSDAAFLVTSILSDNEARKPVFGLNSLLNLTVPAAAKTGTTTSYRDNWTMGFTKHLIVGVWAGNSDGRPMRGVTGVTGAGPIWHEFAQSVISDTATLERLGIPLDESAWQFTPPDTIQNRPVTCPKSMLCPRSEEYFSPTWLAKNAYTGVMSDGVLVRDRVSAIAVGGQFVAACSDPVRGGTRTLFRLPDGMGLLKPTTDLVSGPALAISPGMPVPRSQATVIRPVAAKVPEQVEKERKEVLKWASQHGELLHLGPCDGVEGIVQEIWGTRAVALVPLSSVADVGPTLDSPTLAFSDEVTSTSEISSSVVVTDVTNPGQEELAEGETGAPGDGAAVEEPASAPPQAASGFQLTAVGPSGGCNGNFITGNVIDGGGAPMAGVRVVATDQYGNYAETRSKNGAADYGLFDFSVSGSQNSYYVTLVDEGGNPISPTAMVNHSQPADGNACYWVQFRQGDS